jgi:hypothetical protein
MSSDSGNEIRNFLKKWLNSGKGGTETLKFLTAFIEINQT